MDRHIDIPRAAALAVTAMVLAACAATRPAPSVIEKSQPSAKTAPRAVGSAARSRTIEDTSKSAAASTAPGSAREVPAAPPSTASARAQPAAGPAVVALLEQAQTQARHGDGEQAAATLERAIRIEPRNPWLWHRLAVLRLQQRRYRDAIDLATKSNALAAGDARLLAGNYEVIAQGREALGDGAGAREARAGAQQGR